MIHEFRTPFPVETPLGQGYALYVTPAGMWENDAWCVVLDDGRLLHFTTNQLKYVGNGSYDMKKPRPLQSDPPLTAPASTKLRREDLEPGRASYEPGDGRDRPRIHWYLATLGANRCGAVVPQLAGYTTIKRELVTCSACLEA